jgi:demethylmenaquinone methyltransferase/2-methoxy-6-polyprenyl-1,4-benzoquinol methylase
MAGAAAAPRSTFDCLWCGRPWSTRASDDLEGWAQLCPDCLGRAGENPFLRFRLRDALAARAAATKPAISNGGDGDLAPDAPAPQGGGGAAPAPDDMVAYYEARAAEYDDWYLRRGRYARGPIHDAAWDAELDGAGAWLDALPIRGEIVELAAGTGWWSPLLAGKGELWLYDAAEAPLERARDRLLAHRLRAHIHVRDAWTEPDRQVDALVCNFWLSHVARDRTAAFLELAHRWLKPGGRFAFIDSLPDPQSGAADHPEPAGDRAIRRLADGREFTILKVYRTPGELEDAVRAAGFRDASVTTTGRFFLLGTARA